MEKEQKGQREGITRRSFLGTTAGSALGFAALSAIVPEPLVAFAENDPVFLDLDKNKMLTMYKNMVMSRQFERKCKELGLGLHTSTGEEASAAGVIAALRQDDYTVFSHRNVTHTISKTGDIRRFMAEQHNKDSGFTRGRGGHMHMTDTKSNMIGAIGIMGEPWVIAMGAAMGAMVQGTDRIAVGFVGEGSSNRGICHEAMNAAATMKLPVVFVCENNQFMEGAGFSEFNHPRSYPEVMNTPNVSARAAGYGIPGVSVDGNDVLAVYRAAHTAVGRARRGEGPTLIETMTFRWYLHAGFGGSKPGLDGAWDVEYRTNEELAYWVAKDPIRRFQAFLLSAKTITEKEDQAIQQEVIQKIDDAVTFAKSSKDPDPNRYMDFTYA